MCSAVFFSLNLPKMDSDNVLKRRDINIESSPLPKRARYEMNASTASRWTLTKNELVLHSVYDLGIGRLDSDSEPEYEYNRHQFEKSLNCIYQKYSPDTKQKQIGVIEAALPDNTIQKLSLGELDHLLVKQNNDFKTCDMNYFDLLSDEVILQVFQKLPKSELGNVALVCRRFNNLSEDESLWTRMDICNKKLDKGAMGIIMSRQVIILRLARCNILYPPILNDVKAALPDYRCRLMYLDLSMATVSTKTLEVIFNKCRRLKKLSLENVPVNDDVLIALSQSTELEIINFAMSLGIELTGLTYLLLKCRKIKELNLSWTYLTIDTIDYVCENLPSSMDRFNFSGCRKLLQDKHVENLIKNCPNIRELDLSDCTSLTGESVRQITALEDLNFLALSRCYLIPYRSLLYLKKLKSLTYLDVHGGYIDAEEMKVVKDGLGTGVNINKFKFSSVARPTVGLRRSSIWNMRVRD